MRWLTRHALLASILLAFVLVNLLYFVVSPRELVAYIGVENAYLVTFSIAAIGGLSTFTGTTLYAAIATFASGGANPLLVGLAGGVGIFISDTVFFLLAQYGRRSIEHSLRQWMEKIEDWVRRVPRSVSLGLAYLYLGFTPLPNDVLMLVLVAAGYRYRHLALVLLAGGLTVALLTAHLGERWFL